MNPTPEAQNKIQARVDQSTMYDWTLSDSALADAINADMVANPEPAEQVPVPYTMADVLGALDPATIKLVRSEGNVGSISEAVRNANSERVLTWANAYMITGDLSQAEYDAIEATVTTTQEDPEYDAEIPWSVKELGRKIDSDDVSDSRP